jgi:chemotaxis protein methyltransferase CheR
MSDQAALDALSDLISGRLGLGAQNLRREKLQSALDGLAKSRGKGDALRELGETDFRDAAWQTVIAAATIPETRFLRQRGWFRQIEILALAPLIKRRRQDGNRHLRIWSAGCATGEEPYTLAMLVRDLLPDLSEWLVEIVATDINAEALAQAERGEYAERQLRELDSVEIMRYFEKEGDKRQVVRPELRNMVQFQAANLAADAEHPVFAGRFDLILCRNVLIYLTPAMQRRVAGHLHASLCEGGWLAVAPAEALIDWFHPLKPINAPEAILFRKHDTKHQPSAPLPPAPRGIEFAPKPPEIRTDRVDPTRREPARKMLEEVQSLADRGALAEALKGCRELLEHDALNADACMLLSSICSELGDFSTACEAARSAIYVRPDSADAHFLLAVALRNLGQSARAERTMAIASGLARVVETGDRLSVGESGVGNDYNR